MAASTSTRGLTVGSCGMNGFSFITPPRLLPSRTCGGGGGRKTASPDWRDCRRRAGLIIQAQGMSALGPAARVQHGHRQTGLTRA
eukprot:2369310-Pyramimonas_sp.AAC.1